MTTIVVTSEAAAEALPVLPLMVQLEEMQQLAQAVMVQAVQAARATRLAVQADTEELIAVLLLQLFQEQHLLAEAEVYPQQELMER